MSKILHMETDQVRSVADQINQANEEIISTLDGISGAVQSIDWSGPGRDAFVGQFSRVARTLSQQAKEGQELGKRLQQESNEWEGLANMGEAGGGLLGGLIGGIDDPNPVFKFPLVGFPFIPGLIGIAWPPKLKINLPGIKPPDWVLDLIQPGRGKPPAATPGAIPAQPQPVATPHLPRTETISVNPDARTDDCVHFVEDTGSRPSGFSDKDFYSGNYRGQTGTTGNGWDYGQEPQLDAIMVESPNADAGIDYGHASRIYEVTRDESGKVISYSVAEGNWQGTDSVHYETFYWDDQTNRYVSSTGNRSPDMFLTPGEATP